MVSFTCDWIESNKLTVTNMAEFHTKYRTIIICTSTLHRSHWNGMPSALLRQNSKVFSIWSERHRSPKTVLSNKNLSNISWVFLTWSLTASTAPKPHDSWSADEVGTENWMESVRWNLFLLTQTSSARNSYEKKTIFEKRFAQPAACDHLRVKTTWKKNKIIETKRILIKSSLAADFIRFLASLSLYLSLSPSQSPFEWRITSIHQTSDNNTCASMHRNVNKYWIDISLIDRCFSKLKIQIIAPSVVFAFCIRCS